MKLIRHKKHSRAKRVYLPAVAKQRRRAAGAVMAIRLAMNGAFAHSQMLTILSQPTLPKFYAGGIMSGRAHSYEAEKVLAETEKAIALIDVLKNTAFSTAEIINRQTKLMK